MFFGKVILVFGLAVRLFSSPFGLEFKLSSDFRNRVLGEFEILVGSIWFVRFRKTRLWLVIASRRWTVDSLVKMHSNCDPLWLACDLPVWTTDCLGCYPTIRRLSRCYCAPRPKGQCPLLQFSLLVATLFSKTNFKKWSDLQNSPSLTVHLSLVQITAPNTLARWPVTKASMSRSSRVWASISTRTPIEDATTSP